MLRLLLAFALVTTDAPASDRDPPRILHATLDGVVNPGTADYLVDAVKEASERDYEALLVTLDTPGGMVDSTRAIVRAFLGASIPIIVYVAPQGAHAGSAGVFITLAGHIAAMAPATNIGAAHPVTVTGTDIEKEGGKTMAEKVENDLAAFVRSIAEQRGRNVEWAEKAVRESVAITATEAVANKVVDLMAASEKELLTALDGRRVTLDGKARSLRTADARLVAFRMTIQQRALATLGDPNIAYILVMIGVLGVMMELYHPGLIVPGATGAFFLLLAGIGFNVLPVNVGGIALLAIGIALLVSEIYVTSFGLLTVGGTVALVMGSLLLLDTSDPQFFVDPSFQVSWGIIIPSVALIALVAVGIMVVLLRVQRRRGTTGQEGMVGEAGVARTDVTHNDGSVFVHGELWRATADEPIPAGTTVEIVAVDGLCVRVRHLADNKERGR